MAILLVESVGLHFFDNGAWQGLVAVSLVRYLVKGERRKAFWLPRSSSGTQDIR